MYFMITRLGQLAFKHYTAVCMPAMTSVLHAYLNQYSISLEFKHEVIFFHCNLDLSGLLENSYCDIYKYIENEKTF